MRYRLIVLAFLAALPSCADSRFRITIMPRPELPAGKAQCDIRLEIDGEVEVTVRRDQLAIHTVSGEDARDDGSDCTAPLPAADMPNFVVQPLDSRSEIHIVKRPSARNDFAVVLRIVDSAPGFGRYHFRLTWDAAPGATSAVAPPLSPRKNSGLERPTAPPDFVWNNATEHHGSGSGESVLNETTRQRLGDVRVDIDLGGKVVVSFASDPPRRPRGTARKPLIFTGSVMSREGARIRASMVTQDQRLHGTMTISVDENRNVNSITMNATDGQDHLQLAWDRK